MDGSSADIEIVQVEPRLAAVLRRQVSMAEIPAAQRDARRAIEAALDIAGVRPIGPWLTVWRPPQDGTIDYAPGVFVPRRFDIEGDPTLFTLPSGRAAHLRLNGPYDRLAAAWQSVFDACRADGHELAGVNWEIYTSPGASPETDLYALLN